MSMNQVLTSVQDFPGVLMLSPTAGSQFPQLAWGDHFFYYSPDGTIPTSIQPYGTIITKDYPEDTGSDLDPAGRWRLNIHLPRAAFTEVLGVDDRDPSSWDLVQPDVFLPHPVYAAQSWVAVINPGENTLSTALQLLAQAHQQARARAERRTRRTGRTSPTPRR